MSEELHEPSNPVMKPAFEVTDVTPEIDLQETAKEIGELLDNPSPPIDLHALSQEARETEINPEGFFSRRWESLGRVWHGARKAVAATQKFVTDRWGIEHNGYKLSVAENLKARFYSPVLLAKDPDAYFDFSKNPVVQKAAARDREMAGRRMSGIEADPEALDYIKMGAYELLTMATVRMTGVVALHGASSMVEKVTSRGGKTEGKIARANSKVKDYTESKINLANRGLDNPTRRKLKGYRRHDIKKLHKSQRTKSETELVLEALRGD